MELDPDRCYDAFTAHDARFDGRVFVGVRSTGIYCRPVCRVRTPRRSVCTFYVSAAAAEAAGFRPCLRCRPELAPGLSAMDASATLAHAAAGLIDAHLADDLSVASLAGKVGITDRHLRRLFREHFGVAPADYLRTRRLLLAKRLLTDTGLPVTDVAAAAGFGSLRALEAAFQRHYRMVPSALRGPRRPGADDALHFTLSYRPPLDYARLVDFLAGRTIAGVEQVVDGEYRRSVRLDGVRGWLGVRPGKAALEVTLSASLAAAVPAALAGVRRLFDLDADPAAVTQALGPLAEARPGLRLPGAFDGIEMAVRAVLGQQITVKAARTLAGRFTAAFGTALDTPWAAVNTTFPTAERIAALSVSQIAELGVIRRRAEVIIALAAAVAEGRLMLSPGAPVQDTIAQLQALPGIGPWTAHYIAMRALAWPDAYPDGDYGVRAALGMCSAREARQQAEAWRPWRAYAVMHLWASLGEAEEATS
ncbi:DNA-3-methyladenine glycosylase 2 [Denitromonas iodatirespirans]|uniref:DNA-3-methyladenine glycosylase II n=1 Tax=Denitromonas iodatirespirans TaxID=2795389 RepID=A0A944H614_DENI1|nr:DNA-3-methyladenine glycosylase 2 [Denitromonas iodatirespirans]MBT0959693.1 DNA-3-methyladenine glycosylase 2 [Denitromonas iodatirespirans]